MASGEDDKQHKLTRTKEYLDFVAFFARVGNCSIIPLWLFWIEFNIFEVQNEFRRRKKKSHWGQIEVEIPWFHLFKPPFWQEKTSCCWMLRLFLGFMCLTFAFTSAFGALFESWSMSEHKIMSFSYFFWQKIRQTPRADLFTLLRFAKLSALNTCELCVAVLIC